MIDMTPKEFVDVLKSHRRFVAGKPGGVRANFTLESFKGLRLPGVVLQAAKLTGTDFTRCSLPDADFAFADLYGADFTRADLSRASFRRADVRGSVFKGAKLIDADFEGCDLRPGAYVDSKLKLTGAQGTAMKERRARKLRMSVGRTTFAEAEMQNVILSEAEMYGVDLTDCFLIDANLRDASIKDAKFRNANLTGADFSGSKLDNVDLRGALVMGARFSNTEFVEVKLPVDVDTFDGSIQERLAEHQMWLATLGDSGEPADFSDMDLAEHDFTGLNLTGADFTRAKLQGAVFEDSVLNFANFRGADLQFAVFDGSQMDGTLMGSAIMRRSSFRNARLGMTRLYRHTRTEQRPEPWPTVLSGADARGADFTGTVFENTAVDGLNTLDCRFTGARLLGRVGDADFRRIAGARGAGFGPAPLIHM
jgi:uncharacterized protein YjbI with pentapeptide repeats